MADFRTLGKMFSEGGSKMKNYNIKEILAKAFAIILLISGIIIIGESIYSAMMMIIGAGTIWALVDYARANKNPLTKEQMLHVMRLANKEIIENRNKKQEIINEGAKRGETIPIKSILDVLDESKINYLGQDTLRYFDEVDKMKQELINKFGNSIPVDAAYKMVAEFEADYQSRYGTLPQK
jgi:hypothetical protein